jgi:hypothetical protein
MEEFITDIVGCIVRAQIVVIVYTQTHKHTHTNTHTENITPACSSLFRTWPQTMCMPAELEPHPNIRTSKHPNVNLSNLYIYLSMALQPFVGPWPLFQFLDLYTVGRTSWLEDQPVARPLPTHIDIHALSGIRTHDPSVQAREDGSWFRPRGSSVWSATEQHTDIEKKIMVFRKGAVIFPFWFG